MVSCILFAVVPAALFATENSGAMLYSNGTTWLNGNRIPKSSAVFSGDLVQTKADSVANINAAGSSILIFSDSLVEFHGSSIKVEHGAVTVSTLKGLATRAGDLSVTPASSDWTEFEVKESDGMVRIIARKGDLLIADETGTTTLPQGKQITRDYSESHKKKKRGGGAVPAAKGPVIDSAALVTGGAVGGGLTTWVLMQGDDPVSPSKFK
jgi:hypothetical protein